MSAKVIGNRGAYYRNGPDGIGAPNLPDGSHGWFGAVGKIGDFLLLAHSTVCANNHVDQGYFFQTTGGAKISMTLQNIGLATNPDPLVQADVAWVDMFTLAPGTIEQSIVGFAALRIEWTAPGEVYIVSR